MIKQFDSERFDLVEIDSVHSDDHRFGHSRQGEIDVWIENSDSSERFLSQLIVEGKTYVLTACQTFSSLSSIEQKAILIGRIP